MDELDTTVTLRMTNTDAQVLVNDALIHPTKPLLTPVQENAVQFQVAATEPAICLCFPTPESTWTTHYGAVEPGSTLEPNPDCRVHFPVSETPQGAGELERRERWRAAMHADMTASLSDLMAADPHAPARGSRIMDHCMALSDQETRSEHADLVKRAEDAEARLAIHLADENSAQALLDDRTTERDEARAERDRLRGLRGAVDSAMSGDDYEENAHEAAQEHELSWFRWLVLDAIDRHLATPDADAQDEGVRRGE